jgi:3-isopropylmalate/(R)-2-methylmalate dehydratase small subunit
VTAPGAPDAARRQIVGRGLPLPGNDVDTDRIIPARHLKSVTFAGLGEVVFGDARQQDPEHPFNQAVYRGAAILVVGQNFGCGSSREHAPQALRDWGIRGLVGGSFAEIFFGNCVANGIPCLVADMADVEWLQKAVARSPEQAVTLDVERQEVRFGDRTFAARVPDGARSQLVSGSWNATAVLLEAGEAIERCARALPYVRGY